MIKKTPEIIKTIAIFLSFVILPSTFYIIFEDYGIKDSMILQILSSASLILILVYIYKDTLKKDFRSFKKSNFKIMIKWWLIGFTLMIAANAFVNLIVFKGGIAANEEYNRDFLIASPILGLFLATILSPLAEELTFRRGFRGITKNNVLFIIISSFFFAGMHVLTGFVESYNPLELFYFLPYGALSVAFAIIYVKTKNIYSTIIVHAFHNMVSLLLIFLVSGVF
jgi:membrane protease YdiL (CAAX protease family)